MQRVFVIGNTKEALMPCHPARARHLLRSGQAKVYRTYPFTIILTERAEGEVQVLECKIDPGSKTTGIAIVLHGAKGKKAIWAGHVKHRGSCIMDALTSRCAMRRSRRHRKTRYRAPRFDNRCRKLGWLPDHIHPRSKGGSNRVSNLNLSCRPCNESKGNRDINAFLSHDQKRLEKILGDLKKPLNDAAAVNTTRFAIGNRLKELALPIAFSSGGQTKFNRTQQGYAKDHFIDAICVGESGARVYIPSSLTPLHIQACGRGSRQMCRVTRHGFPRTRAKSKKQVYGFKTGDIVHGKVTRGKKTGSHVGRVAVRASGNFNIKTNTGVIQGIHYRYCRVLHRADGYNYSHGGGVSSST